MLVYSDKRYVLSASGIRMKAQSFGNRRAATEAMYNFISRKHLVLQEVYDDKHYKTYICNNNIRFYVQRMF